MRIAELVSGRRARPLSRLIGVALGGLLLAACGSAAATAAPASSGGTVSFAMPPATGINYIFPLVSAANCSSENGENFQYLMYRPLYWYGDNGVAKVNPQLSLAQLPQFSHNGRVVTIRLKSYRWSDGQPVTARDVIFWLNVLKAEKANWCSYVPGAFPDNVVNYRATNPSTVTLTLNRTYSRYWLLYNELSQITPLPQQAWDKTSAAGRVGNYDTTPAGARAVYKFLNAQASTTSTYASNPIWQVVDGPFRVSGYNPTTQDAVLVPNRSYSGSPRPRISRLDLVAFTSDTAEFDALRAGQIDYGYLPLQDLSQRSELTRLGYAFQPWHILQFSYLAFNFANRAIAPLVNQLYLRQALQHLIDEPAYVQHIDKGFGVSEFGPVPIAPANPFASAYERHNAYPYSPAAARQLLASHGWTVVANGQSRCSRPGTRAGQCGAGIRAGATITLTNLIQSGLPSLTSEMEAFQSAALEVGIRIALRQEPINTVLSTAVACTRATGTGCSWEIADPAPWFYAPDFYPSGGTLFACGGGYNIGSWCNKTNDANVLATHLSSSPAAMTRYENYVAAQLPVLWIPNQPWQLSEIAKHLHGALPQDPYLNYYPETWSWSGPVPK
ncbi:MAG TPA: peptide ABC transporter substrate-binding protein [Verrucomicrobiae bacterium]|nr:peptide ABC transporter substrate-binding protein [Verrucomicrobiae bacterium]